MIPRRKEPDTQITDAPIIQKGVQTTLPPTHGLVPTKPSRRTRPRDCTAVLPDCRAPSNLRYEQHPVCKNGVHESSQCVRLEMDVNETTSNVASTCVIAASRQFSSVCFLLDSRSYITFPSNKPFDRAVCTGDGSPISTGNNRMSISFIPLGSYKYSATGDHDPGAYGPPVHPQQAPQLCS